MFNTGGLKVMGVSRHPTGEEIKQIAKTILETEDAATRGADFAYPEQWKKNHIKHCIGCITRIQDAMSDITFAEIRAMP